MAIFSDGQVGSTMETVGDFSAWTGTNVQSGNTLEVQTTIKHHGSNAAHSHTLIYSNRAFCYKQFTAGATFFARFYVYPTTNPYNNESFKILTLANWHNWPNDIISAELRNVAGTLKWALLYRSGAGYTESVLASPLPTLNNHYCVEIKGLVDASVGEARLYIDGTEGITITGLANNDLGNIEELDAGINYGSADAAADIYFDCVVLDSAPIGPETTGGPTVKKGSNLSNTMTTMLNSKMLFSQCNRFPKLTPRRL
jgi:hypothetical protein